MLRVKLVTARWLFVARRRPRILARDTFLLKNQGRLVPLRPPWAAADVAQREFTFGRRGQQIRRVAPLGRSGDQVVFARGRVSRVAPQ
jgi:hypothetical protein